MKQRCEREGARVVSFCPVGQQLQQKLVRAVEDATARRVVDRAMSRVRMHVAECATPIPEYAKQETSDG